MHYLLIYLNILIEVFIKILKTNKMKLQKL